MIVYCQSKDDKGNLQVTIIDGKQFEITHGNPRYSQALICYNNDLAFSIDVKELERVDLNEK